MIFPLWRFRLAAAGRFGYHPEVWKVWEAWARAEGGTARFNPFNTTEPWPGASEYNTAGVKNYPSAQAGIAATVATLRNGFYPGLVRDFTSPRGLTARQIVARNAGELNTWGTGYTRILALLPKKQAHKGSSRTGISTSHIPRGGGGSPRKE